VSPKLSPELSQAYRAAIAEAEGHEVSAIADVVDGKLVNLTIVARGQIDRVHVRLKQPKPGQVILHNHPSGDLRPSDADMALAGAFSEDGIGFAIVDNDVRRAWFVVEPWNPAKVMLSHDAVRDVFLNKLPLVMPGWETRQAQLDMALEVTDTLNLGKPLVCEAGTGTGKSLAYLVPAALWAAANEARVVVSTFTRALQGQLQDADVPLLMNLDLGVKIAVLEGRGNYLCKRRLQIAAADPTREKAELEALQALQAWSKSSPSGSRSHLGMDLPPDVWELVDSDSHMTLRQKCEHFENCHYYNARRKAAGAQVIVVNHALLLTDRVLRADVGRGLLPDYDRLVLDEAHHLESAATSVTSANITRFSLKRSVQRVLGRKKRKGILQQLERLAGKAIEPSIDHAKVLTQKLLQRADVVMDQVASSMDPSQPTARITDDFKERPEWQMEMLPALQSMAFDLDQTAAAYDKILGYFDDNPVPQEDIQPVLNLRRARDRVEGQSAVLRDILTADDPDTCRWVAVRHVPRRNPEPSLSSAPIKVAPTVAKVLWHPVPGSVSTSATMTVADQFRHWRKRVGLRKAVEAIFPSPFDYPKQAVLAVADDLPDPSHPKFRDEASAVTCDAVGRVGGGVFVLCTAYADVQRYAADIRRRHPNLLVLEQRPRAGTSELLRRFLQASNAVLVGTDSFWEGVSVKGRHLRLVVIPRLPFRVPTDPLAEARFDAIRADGGDPFRHYALPEATIRLKQGFGRLIRTATDRGSVLILDGRIVRKRYGGPMLASLPPAQRVIGPWWGIADQVADACR